MALHYAGGILEARGGNRGACGADDQQLQATGTRLRSPGKSGVLAAQSVRRNSHPDVLAVGWREAIGSPLP